MSARYKEQDLPVAIACLHDSRAMIEKLSKHTVKLQTAGPVAR
jgi:hypothetical protein